MENKYELIFDKDLLKGLLFYGNRIPKDATDKEIYEVFNIWLEKNKQFRQDIIKLNDEELKQYNNTLKEKIDLTLKKSQAQLFFGFDRINYYLRLLILEKEPKKISKHDEFLEHYNKSKEPKLTPLTFSDFMLKEDRKEYYVKQMFAKGTINMIFSPPKQMKSFVSYYLALCLATGNNFLNQKTKKVPIGYFDWENPFSDIQNRIKGMCTGMNFKTEEIDNFYFFTKQPTLLRVNSYDSYVIEELRDELITFIKENGLKVIFFDTLRRLGNFDENDSGAINTIKSELFDPLIKECNVCIIFLHHTSKEGKNYRGSVDIEGILDASFKITKKEHNGELKLNITCDARRNNEIEKLSAIIDIENNSIEDEDGEMYESIESVKFMRLEEKEDTSEKNTYSEYRSYFIETLKIGNRYKNKDLLELIEDKFGIKKVTANKIIKWLLDKNILKSFGENKNKYYILNPVHGTRDEEIQLKELDKHFKEHFKKNDLVDIELLKGEFEEKYYSLIISDWNKKGWINTAKAGYLMVTEQFKSENFDEKIEVEEVGLNED